MKPLLAAIQFLTILPLPRRIVVSEDDLARSVPLFPVVGLGIGALGALAAWAAWAAFPPLLAGVLVVLMLVAVSGGLHLDGLSDTADGFLSSRPRDRILEIMRDSHIGAMGVIAIVAVLLIKSAALAALSRDMAWRCAFLMPVAGRGALVISMALLPYARTGGGLGTVFYRNRSIVGAVWACALVVVSGWLLARLPGVVAAVASLLVTLVFAGYTYRKIGGATGDTLGAACEIAETVPALILAAWFCGPS